MRAVHCLVDFFSTLCHEFGNNGTQKLLWLLCLAVPQISRMKRKKKRSCFCASFSPFLLDIWQILGHPMLHTNFAKRIRWLQQRLMYSDDIIDFVSSSSCNSFKTHLSLVCLYIFSLIVGGICSVTTIILSQLPSAFYYCSFTSVLVLPGTGLPLLLAYGKLVFPLMHIVFTVVKTWIKKCAKHDLPRVFSI